MHQVRACISLAAAIAICAACRPNPDVNLPAAELAPGTWGWKDNPETNCETNPHTISFSEDKRLLFLKLVKPARSWDGQDRSTVHYRVEQLQPVLRLSLIGETRRTDDGKKVVWDLVMLSHDEYCWHRTDWPTVECTSTVQRCPASAGP